MSVKYSEYVVTTVTVKKILDIKSSPQQWTSDDKEYALLHLLITKRK